VHLSDGRNYPGELIGADDKTDVAVLRIRRVDRDPPLPVVRLGNSDSVQVGEWAMAIGNPLGQLEGSSRGSDQRKGRSDLDIMGRRAGLPGFPPDRCLDQLRQLGGPLVNTRGEVIGINAAINPTGQGLGFAIPVNMARIVSEQLIATGSVVRGYMGIVPQQLTPELTEGLGLAPGVKGILISSVEEHGPADRAGLRQKDVILSLNGTPTQEVNRFRRLVAEAPVGARVGLEILRDGRTIQRMVELVRRPDDPAVADAPVQSPKPKSEPAEWLGARLEPMTRELAGQFETSYNPGLVVTARGAGSPADEAGLTEGDLILEVNEAPVRTLDDWGDALAGLKRRTRPVVLLVSRDGVVSYVAVRLGPG